MTRGWAEPILQGQKIFGLGGSKSSHDNPITNQPCPGTTLQNYHLGHRFMTDVLEIRLSGYHHLFRKTPPMLSLMYALLDGASEELGIRRNDIDGNGTQFCSNEPPSLIIYDNVPGGAGHVERIKKEFAPIR